MFLKSTSRSRTPPSGHSTIIQSEPQVQMGCICSTTWWKVQNMRKKREMEIPTNTSSVKVGEGVDGGADGCADDRRCVCVRGLLLPCGPDLHKPLDPCLYTHRLHEPFCCKHTYRHTRAHRNSTLVTCLTNKHLHMLNLNKLLTRAII